jgi:hypothetical protein
VVPDAPSTRPCEARNCTSNLLSGVTSETTYSGVQMSLRQNVILLQRYSGNHHPRRGAWFTSGAEYGLVDIYSG